MWRPLLSKCGKKKKAKPHLLLFLTIHPALLILHYPLLLTCPVRTYQPLRPSSLSLICPQLLTDTFILITSPWPASPHPPVLHSFPSPTHSKSISSCHQFLSWLIPPNTLLKVLQARIFAMWQSHFCLNLRLFTSPLSPGILSHLPLTLPSLHLPSFSWPSSQKS